MTPERPPGVVLDTGRTLVLDTRELPWEPDPAGSWLRRSLAHRAAEDDALMMWLPETAAMGDAEPPDLDLGPAWILVLGGDLAIRPAGAEAPIVLRAGCWVDIAPGARLPLDRPFRSDAGFLALVVRSRPRDAIVADMPGVLVAGPVTVIDTLSVPWTAHFGMAVGKTKVLGRSAAGIPLAYLTRTPPASGPSPTRPPARHYHRTVSERIFVVGGRLALREWAGLEDAEGVAVVLRDGFFVDRLPGSIHAVEARSPVGFASLELRTAAGNYEFDVGYEGENWTE